MTPALGVWAGPHLRRAAQRLAHREGGVLLDGPALAVDRLIVLCDAADLSIVRHLSIRAQHTLALAVDLPGAVLAAALPDAEVREVRPTDPLRLWPAVVDALSERAAPVVPLASMFLSHAVADEPQLLPVVDSLRKAGADIFLCADSIRPGERWLDRILDDLEARDRFVLAVSQASVGSAFCGFEVGWARRAGKPLRAVSLDGTPPPGFLGDQQAYDVPRYQRARPWLEPAEALFEVLLDALV